MVLYSFDIYLLRSTCYMLCLLGNLVSHAPTPFPHCQVYINHHYKFIWIKGHKVASTAMRKPLGSLCGDKWKVGPNVSYEYCSEPLFRDKKVTVAEIRQWWKEYFVFGIVRNPYTRFASAEVSINHFPNTFILCTLLGVCESDVGWNVY